jgi:hypothetical protein
MSKGAEERFFPEPEGASPFPAPSESTLLKKEVFILKVSVRVPLPSGFTLRKVLTCRQPESVKKQHKTGMRARRSFMTTSSRFMEPVMMLCAQLFLL